MIIIAYDVRRTTVKQLLQQTVTIIIIILLLHDIVYYNVVIISSRSAGSSTRGRLDKFVLWVESHTQCRRLCTDHCRPHAKGPRDSNNDKSRCIYTVYEMRKYTLETVL